MRPHFPPRTRNATGRFQLQAGAGAAGGRLPPSHHGRGGRALGGAPGSPPSRPSSWARDPGPPQAQLAETSSNFLFPARSSADSAPATCPRLHSSAPPTSPALGRPAATARSTGGQQVIPGAGGRPARQSPRQRGAKGAAGPGARARRPPTQEPSPAPGKVAPPARCPRPTPGGLPAARERRPGLRSPPRPARAPPPALASPPRRGRLLPPTSAAARPSAPPPAPPRRAGPGPGGALREAEAGGALRPRGRGARGAAEAGAAAAPGRPPSRFPFPGPRRPWAAQGAGMGERPEVPGLLTSPGLGAQGFDFKL